MAIGSQGRTQGHNQDCQGLDREDYSHKSCPPAQVLPEIPVDRGGGEKRTDSCTHVESARPHEHLHVDKKPSDESQERHGDREEDTSRTLNHRAGLGCSGEKVLSILLGTLADCRGEPVHEAVDKEQDSWHESCQEKGQSEISNRRAQGLSNGLPTHCALGHGKEPDDYDQETSAPEYHRVRLEESTIGEVHRRALKDELDD